MNKNSKTTKNGTSKEWRIHSVNGFRKEESVFIHEEESSKVFDETDIKQFDINKDIDKWEYKNLTKDSKTGGFDIESNTNLDPKSSYMDLNSGISINVLNSTNTLTREKVVKGNHCGKGRKNLNSVNSDSVNNFMNLVANKVDHID